MMKALLLLAFGGPRSLDEVEFFLTRLFRGRKPSPEQLERVKERYRMIGGASPLPGITEGQAKALEGRLNGAGYAFKAFVGMRYGRPLIEDVLAEIIRDGIREVIAIPMAPFRSRASTVAYVQQNFRERMEITFVEGWHLHPVFLEAVREKIRDGLLEFSLEAREKVHLIFTAHSLPKSIVVEDFYAQDFEASVKGVMEGGAPLPWHMAFQSKGGGAEEWAGPDVESLLERLSAEGVRDILIVPIGFVSDHVEILYDIDIVFRKKAESMGMVLKRSRSLNLSERFIHFLATLVEEHIPKSNSV
jgi:ferrochelatase